MQALLTQPHQTFTQTLVSEWLRAEEGARDNKSEYAREREREGGELSVVLKAFRLTAEPLHVNPVVSNLHFTSTGQEVLW